MAICIKTFAIAFLYIYIANQQDHDSQEKVTIEWKTVKAFHTEVLPYTVNPPNSLIKIS